MSLGNKVRKHSGDEDESGWSYLIISSHVYYNSCISILLWCSSHWERCVTKEHCEPYLITKELKYVGNNRK